jgi:hypothetical protein
LADRQKNEDDRGIKMKTRLSAWNYIKNNKKTVGGLIVALAISFMAMYVVYVLLATSIESYKPIMFELPKRQTFVSLTPDAMGVKKEEYETTEEYSEAIEKRRNEIIDELKKHEGIDDACYTQILHCVYASVMGQWAYEVPLLEKEDIPSYLEHVGAELVEGRMPEGDGEILVDKTIMKNRGLSVGSWFMQDWYGENFKVCGVIESEGMACVGTPMGYTNGGLYMLILNDEKTCDAEKFLGEIGITISDQDEIVDAVTLAEQYNSEIKGPIEAVINAVFAVVIIFLAISVLVAYLSFMRNRVNEYCLYASIGYSRNDIYGMIIREMLLIFGIGIVVGFLAAIVTAVIINKTVIDPKGLVGHILYGNRLYGIVSTYVLIMGVLQLPVLLNINDIKTIDAIED